MRKYLSVPLCGALALAATSGQAQTEVVGEEPATEASEAMETSPQPQAAPVVAMRKAEEKTTVLPANTEVLLSMNEELTTKNKKTREGDTFYMTVVHDVMLDDYVVIPKGARAAGEVTWLTGKGAFGKSGKMEIELRYAEVGGKRIPLEGTFRQNGEGNTVATVAGVVAAGVFAAFITGKSGVIPEGRELMVRTKEDTPVQLASAPVKPAGLVATRTEVQDDSGATAADLTASDNATSIEEPVAPATASGNQ